MNQHEVAFLRRLALARPAEERSPLAPRMAEYEGLGRVSGAHVVYSEADYERARSLLLSRGYPLVAKAPGYTRSQAGPGPSEKAGALPVSEDLVAIVPLSMQLQAPKHGFLAMPWRDVMALPYEVLLVCENLEPLLNLGEYLWLTRFVKERPAVAVFRGTANTFGTHAAALLIAADHRPTLAFFDFDPKGLSMAASVPRREALCLPDWEVLEPAVREAKRGPLFTNSAQGSRAHLDRVTDPEIALAWSRLKVLTKGLDQEGFPRAK